MAAASQVTWLMAILRDTVVGLAREDGRDLTARQLGVLLVCYLEYGPLTVRGLAVRLNTPKPSICRAIDRLVSLNLASRGGDPRDRRSILVTRTAAGTSYMIALRDLMLAAARGPNLGDERLLPWTAWSSPACPA